MKYEYKKFYTCEGKNSEDKFIEGLNTLGEQGWRVVTSCREFKFVEGKMVDLPFVLLEREVV